jgi:hypothetical protein
MTTQNVRHRHRPVARQEALWLMGLIAPTALFVVLPLVWAFNQWGWQMAAPRSQAQA